MNRSSIILLFVFSIYFVVGGSENNKLNETTQSQASAQLKIGLNSDSTEFVNQLVALILRENIDLKKWQPVLLSKKSWKGRVIAVPEVVLDAGTESGPAYFKALVSLSKVEDAGYNALVQLLNNPGSCHKAGAAYALSLNPIFSQRAVSNLTDALSSSSKEVVANALGALCAAGSKAAPATQNLLQVISNFKEEEVQVMAILVLERIGNTAAEALPILRTASQSSNSEHVRQAALNAIARIETSIEQQNQEKAPLHSEPLKKINEKEVNELLKKYDFYCANFGSKPDWGNPFGKGFPNKFRVDKDHKVVIDSATKLMWAQKTLWESIPVDEIFKRIESFKEAEKYIKKLNEEKYAGYSNWRLPTLKEAMSLMEPERNHKKPNLFIDPVFSSSLHTWTSDQTDIELDFFSKMIGSVTYRWAVYFDRGDCRPAPIVSIFTDARAVRSLNEEKDSW